MGKGTIKTKAMTMAVAMSMVAGLCPSTVFAANSEVVAKVQDGTYTGTAECTPDGDGEFTKYNLSLSVTVEDGKIKLEEIYRFENGISKIGDEYCWDIQGLFNEIKKGIKKCKEIGKVPKNIGIDTWAVDFVLLDEKYSVKVT